MSSPPPGAAPRRPTFLCIGAGKAGTTWLWDVLRQHPDVFLPGVKEVHYFNEIAYEGPDVRNPNFGRPDSWYLRFFEGAAPAQVCGEFSPSYLWSDTAPARIHAFDPEMRILVLLRDPVERLFSSYLFGQQKGEIGKISFEEALRSVDYLLARAPSSKALRRYIELFGRERVTVVFHESIRKDPEAVLHEVERFIGVRPFVPVGFEERRNVTGASRFPTVTRLLMRNRIRLKRHGFEWAVDAGKRVGLAWPFRWFQAQVRPYRSRPRVDPATEADLRRFFLEDVEGLEALLDVDLSRWKPRGAVSGRSAPAGR
ncbi:MAG: sulfotransferase [Acidimicrobiia bacterium]|nr:sulfotransferase [Acidimicrobiia bacterium]